MVNAAFGAWFVVSLTLGAGLGAWVIVTGYSPVPFGDFWWQFEFIERGLDGSVGLGDLWAQHQEHRIALARIQFLVDYGIFSGTNVFLFTAIAATCVALAAVFALATYAETGDWLLALGTLAVAATCTLSPVDIENLTWAFQVQFVQVFLFPAIAVYATVAATRAGTPTRSALLTTAAAIAAIAATYSMANGLFTWPVVIALALLLRGGPRTVGFLSVTGAVSIASFVWAYEVTLRGSLDKPVGLARFISLYLGSMLRIEGATIALTAGAIGAMLFGALCVIAWRRRATQSFAIPFALGVTSFVLLTAAQTASGRLHFGTQQALESRYSIGSFVFWLGLMVGFMPIVRERFRSPADLAYVAVAGFVALGISVVALPNETSLRANVFSKDTAVLAYRAGVNDVPMSVTGAYITSDEVRAGLRFLEQRGLGPWADAAPDRIRVDGNDAHMARACRGQVESHENLGHGMRLHGWIETPAGESPSRDLVVLDEAGREVGLGLRSEQTGDAPHSTGFVAYVRGDDSRRLAIILVGDDHRSPICQLVKHA
jgi:hypothetical protein